MNEIINTNNFNEYKRKIKGNFQDIMRLYIIDIIETNYSYLIESIQLTVNILDEITESVADDDEMHNYINSVIIDTIQKSIKENELKEEEEEEI